MESVGPCRFLHGGVTKGRAEESASVGGRGIWAMDELGLSTCRLGDERRHARPGLGDLQPGFCVLVHLTIDGRAGRARGRGSHPRKLSSRTLSSAFHLLLERA
jgi:hypothetical protein